MSEALSYLLNNLQVFLPIPGLMLLKYYIGKKSKIDDVKMIRELHKLGNIKSVSPKDGKVEFYEEQKKEKSPT